MFDLFFIHLLAIPLRNVQQNIQHVVIGVNFPFPSSASSIRQSRVPVPRTTCLCFFGRQNFFLEGTCPYMLTCKERDIHEFCFTQAILEYTT